MEEIVEIFGKRLKIVTDEDDNARICKECAVKVYCWQSGGDPICEDADGRENRHFELVKD